MKLRFQMGSNSPLAKRNARMFCAASLPRKWSMRKIWSSSNTSCSLAFNATALSRSVPNGFSMMIARAVDQAGFSEQAHRRQRRVRRHAEIVEPAALAVEGSFGLDDGRLQRFGAGRHRHVVQAVRKRIPVGLDHLAGGEFGKRLARELAKAIGIEIIEGYADDAASRDESRAREMKHAGQQSAAGKIAGGAHENHDLRKPRTHTLRYPCHVNVL